MRPKLGRRVAGILLVSAACSAPHPTPRSPSPDPVDPGSPTPALGDLIDVVGEPIDVSTLSGTIAFSSGVEDVYVVEADGSGLRRVTDDGGLDFDPTWSPDGSSIAYRHEDEDGGGASSDIFVIPAAGGRPRNLTRSAGVADWGPAWAPDADTIAWNSDRDDPGGGVLHGFVMGPDGRSVRAITRALFFEYPAWSPDGSRIAFMSPTPFGTENYEIFVISADGTGLRRLTESDGPDGWPAWSPDGRLIAFSSVRDDCAFSGSEDCLTTGDAGPYHTVYVMNADGTGQRRLTRTFGQFPAWAPDGEVILFAPFLNVIRPDGTGLARIEVSGLPAEPEMPDWVA